MGRKVPADALRHMSFAIVGGFFGAYAILGPSGVFGNAQTVNLLQLLFDSLFGQWSSLLLHVGALLCYIVGVISAVLLRKKYNRDTGRISPIITAVCAILLDFLPSGLSPMVYLYPIFFAMSFQWTAFTGACGFNSATIFSTNNVKQASVGFAEYLCDGDRSHLRRTVFFGLTLLSFHLGAALAFGAIKWSPIHPTWFALPLLLLSYASVVYEERVAEAATVDVAAAEIAAMEETAEAMQAELPTVE